MSDSSPEGSPTFPVKNPGTGGNATDPSDASFPVLDKEEILSLPNLKQMNCHGQIKELQTIIRNK